MKVLIGVLLAIGAMGYAQSTHLVEVTPEQLTSVASRVAGPAVDANQQAADAQCEAIRLSTGSTKLCAVMMTPAELAAHH